MAGFLRNSAPRGRSWKHNGRESVKDGGYDHNATRCAVCSSKLVKHACSNPECGKHGKKVR